MNVCTGTYDLLLNGPKNVCLRGKTSRPKITWSSLVKVWTLLVHIGSFRGHIIQVVVSETLLNACVSN